MESVLQEIESCLSYSAGHKINGEMRFYALQAPQEEITLHKQRRAANVCPACAFDSRPDISDWEQNFVVPVFDVSGLARLALQAFAGAKSNDNISILDSVYEENGVWRKEKFCTNYTHVPIIHLQTFFPLENCSALVSSSSRDYAKFPRTRNEATDSFQFSIHAQQGQIQRIKTICCEILHAFLYFNQVGYSRCCGLARKMHWSKRCKHWDIAKCWNEKRDLPLNEYELDIISPSMRLVKLKWKFCLFFICRYFRYELYCFLLCINLQEIDLTERTTETTMLSSILVVILIQMKLCF